MILHKTLSIAEVIILCLVLGFVSISLLTASQSKKSSDWGLMDLQRNWNTDFISDVWIGYSRDCPSGQEAVSHQFGGLQEFKLCQNHGVYSTEDLSSNTYGCQVVSSPNLSLSVWAGGKTLCVKRMNGINFQETARHLDSNLACAGNRRRCGDAQSKLGFVCIPQEFGKCPVSGFYFTDKGAKIPSQDLSVLNYNSTHDLVVERSGDPLISVAIQEARICNGTETPPLTLGRSLFKYSKESKRECDKNVDERYKVVSSFGEDDFFKTNYPKLADILMNSQGISGKYNYSIQTRSLSPYAQSCRSQMDFVPKILEKEMLVENSAANVRTLIWVMFYFLLILIIVSCGAFCARKSLFWQVRSILTLAGFFTCMLLLGYWLIRPAGDMRELKKAASRKCSDPFTEKQLEAGRSMFKTDVLDHGWYTEFILFIGFLGLLIVFYLQRNKHLKVMESPEILFYRTEDFYGVLEDSLTGEKLEMEIPEHVYNQSPLPNTGLLDGKNVRVRPDLTPNSPQQGRR